MMTVREAKVRDVIAMHDIRLRVRENQLSDPTIVIEQDYHEFMARDTGSWVCEVGGTIAGFAMVDVEKQNVWALFVAPEHEFKGVGRLLHDTMLQWYFERADVLGLTTGPNTRAEAFYLKAGYTAMGTTSSGEVVFELHRSA